MANRSPITLDPTGPFDLQLSLQAASCFLPASTQYAETLRMAIRLDGAPAAIEIRQTRIKPATIKVVASGLPNKRQLRAAVAWIISADLHLVPFCRAVARHRVLGPISLFNAFYDERCFLPIHVYGTATGWPVAFILRPGKTPSGVEVRGHSRRIIRRIRQHWPETRLTIRGDSHYGRHEAMEWCENNGVDYVFGLAGNAVLEAAVRVQSNRIIARRRQKTLAILRGHTEIKYGAKSWNRERRTCVRFEDKETLGTDIGFVVTNITE